MSHDLMRNRMAFVGETPWHKLGRRVAPTIDSAAMLREAGLAWVGGNKGNGGVLSAKRHEMFQFGTAFHTTLVQRPFRSTEFDRGPR